MNSTSKVSSSLLAVRFKGWFILSSVFVLAITGLAKVGSIFGHTRILSAIDPITGAKFGQLMLTVGILELVIASVCLFTKSETWKFGLIAWLATSFVVYRLGLWWIGWRKPCDCMGSLTDALHIPPEVADNLMKVILAYLLIGSYGLLVWQWRAAKSDIQVSNERVETV